MNAEAGRLTHQPDLGTSNMATMDVSARETGDSDKFFTSLRTYRQNFNYILQRYGLLVDAGRVGPRDRRDIQFSGRAILSEAVTGISLLRDELGKYPSSYIKSLGIKHVRIVSEMKYDNLGIVGFASSSGDLYVSLKKDKDETRRVIHHELFHHRDFQAERVRKGHFPLSKVSPVWKKVKERRSAASWQKIMPDGGTVYKNDRWMWGDTFLDKTQDGFVKAYGMKDVYEDRATIAEVLMTDPQLLLRLSEKDTILSKKVKRITTLFEESSHGRMNKGFFSHLLRGWVSEGYWETPEAIGEKIYSSLPSI